MKTHLATFLLTGLLLAGSANRMMGDETTAPIPAAKEMAALEHFLDLTNEDLDQMQRVIARIRAMGPEERTVLRQEIQKYRQMPEAQRRNLRQGWGAMDRELQNGWRRMMQTASPERRAEIQAQMQAQPPEKKAALREQLVREFLQTEAKK